MSYDKESSVDRLEAWRVDLQEDISEADWEMACIKAQKQSINTRMKLLQHKWLMRMYITPVKLNHWCTDIPDACIKCLEGKGTLYHCVWECPQLNEYWGKVVENISGIVGVKVPHQAKLCVLGIYPDSCVVNSEQSTLIDFGLLQARRMIALSWKKMDIPLINVWIKEMASSVVLERLTYITRGNAEKCGDPY